jgi:D-arabinose 1-dehydrogenase-like Zn-dependent alcohol dehydrogenase
LISYQVIEHGQPLQKRLSETPKPQGSEVLVRITRAGVCHSDLHIWDGYFDLGGGKRLSLQDRGMKLPVTLGHENVGEVVAAGPDAKGVKIGQKMLANPWIGCGVCAVCQRGEDNLCRAMRSLGVFTNGGYATHMNVPHPRYLHDIGDLDPARAAPLACSGVTTYGALKKIGPTLTTDPTVIIGAGGLGLMCLALHQAMGGHSAIVVDIDAGKRDAAKKAGAAHVVDGKAVDAVQQLMALTGGAGAWAVIDLVGSSQSARLGYDSLIKGGKYIIVGLYGGDLTVSLPPIPMRALTIQGSYVGNQHEMKELMELVRAKGLPDVPVATRPLKDVNAVHGELRAGKVVGRVVLTPAAG